MIERGRLHTPSLATSVVALAASSDVKRPRDSSAAIRASVPNAGIWSDRANWRTALELIPTYILPAVAADR